jgi:hypothetical protein
MLLLLSSSSCCHASALAAHAAKGLNKGLNVVFVSRQLGHSSPTITLDVYAHLFEQAYHAVGTQPLDDPDVHAHIGEGAHRRTL